MQEVRITFFYSFNFMTKKGKGQLEVAEGNWRLLEVC